MSIKVKSYQRKTKKGIKVVNSFIRKGDKKKEKAKLIKVGAIGALTAGLLVGGILKRKQLGKLLSTAGQKIKSKFINVAKNESNIVKEIGEQVSKNKGLEEVIPISKTKSNNLINTVKSNNQSLKKEIKKAKFIDTKKEFIPEKIPDPWENSIPQSSITTKLIKSENIDSNAQKLLLPAKKIENKYPEINSPWDENINIKINKSNSLIDKKNKIQLNSENKEQKLLSPGKEIETPKKSKKINQKKENKKDLILEGKKLEGRDRSHPKVRSVNRKLFESVKKEDYKSAYKWDEKLVKNKNVLEMAKSSDATDRQRANEIFRKINSERNGKIKNLNRKVEKASKNVDKKVAKINDNQLNNVEQKLKTLINTNMNRIEKNKKQFLHNLESENKQKLSQKAGRAAAQVDHIKNVAEQETIGKVKGTRRDLIQLFIPKGSKKAVEEVKKALDTDTGKKTVEELQKLKGTVQNQLKEGKKIIENKKEELEDLKKSANELKKIVEEKVDNAKNQKDKLIDTVKKKLEEGGIISNAPKSKPTTLSGQVGENLIKTAKKEIKKEINTKALNTANPLLARVYRVVDDVKGRIDQAERLSDELEKNGEKVLGRRGFLINTGKKAAIESSKKPKDAYYVGKGTITKGKGLISRSGARYRNMENNINQGGNFYKGTDHPFQVYQRTSKVGYRPARGLLEKLRQSGDRLARWKSGDTDAWK